jgi:kynurenine formamidase
VSAAAASLVGVGVETVGTDAGAAHSFAPPFPVHSFLLGAGRYGLTQLANLAQLPPTGAVVVVAPLKLVRGRAARRGCWRWCRGAEAPGRSSGAIASASTCSGTSASLPR